MMADRRELLAGCRVLIVEDEYFLAADLEAELKSCGAEIVGPIGNLSEAVKQVSRDEFDVALVDVNLHGEPAYSLADELVSNEVPFCFVTGYAAKILPTRFRQIKVWSKPFEVGDLVDYVAELCDKTVRGKLAHVTA
ncbi:response regulator [Bradyrhizobium cenepequi]|uniref:response regulator n=1 Tax=Bradyrhizobium cenepequi TaxID=2821403 RepID=UPI001CE2989D|nr:response regulator [Bradyrhizobium cenepequi]MCA6106112.1 response regulator [Bradyrhizobium cenepequi]